MGENKILVRKKICGVIFFLALSIGIVLLVFGNKGYRVIEKKYIEYISGLKNAGNTIEVQIDFTIDRIGGKGNIGSDWVYKHFFNGAEFENGARFKIKKDESFSIKSKFTEDDGTDDVGEATSDLYMFSRDQHNDEVIISQVVHVEEDGGKKYAGSYVDYEVTYAVKRIFYEVTEVDKRDVFSYAYNCGYEDRIYLLIIAEVICILTGVIAIVKKRKYELLEKEQERVRREQKFQEEKHAFLERLGGRSIREMTGVPQNISFVNGLPKDNNNELYGNFTVYRTKNGKCFHEKAGCCSARIPTHYFKCLHYSKPCTKCCTRQYVVPKWYIEYNLLIQQAKKYGIDVNNQ